jgi:hypothetical protein
VTHLDHDHRERENVRFLAIYPIVQDLWGSPSRGMVMVTRDAQLGIYACGDRSETKIRDPCMAVGIHKDIWLDTRQYGGETSVRAATYSL